MKILYVTTISGTMGFFKSLIGELVEQGHTVDLACNCSKPVNEFYNQLGCKIYNMPFSRNPFSKSNLKAYSDLKSLVEKENYDIVHCHTPVAAACTRIACIKVRKKGTKVFYTAHGFHFYKGAPFKNWLIYYPIEKICSYFTDVLITINKEDFALAKLKMKSREVEYVPGVGIDTQFFAQTIIEKNYKRKEINVPIDATLMISVGELNTNKNHKTVIDAMVKLDDNIHYVIAGNGSLHDDILKFAEEKGLKERVHLLGRRSDVSELYKAADFFVHPSFREGLPVSVMEAIASGLPIIASNIRGNKDLINCETGYNFSPFSSDDFCTAFKALQKDIASNTVKLNKEILKYDKKTINSYIYDLYTQN